MTDEQQQRARKILEAVANIDVTSLTLHVHNGRISGCSLCTMPNHVAHDDDCPVVQARILLDQI